MSRIPLNKNMVGRAEIDAAKAVLDSGLLTMGRALPGFRACVRRRNSASRYAVMVNSGSSANLLAMFVLANPLLPAGQARPARIMPGAKSSYPR